MEKFKYSFGSLLGHDEESWGLSYTGQSPAEDPDTATSVGGIGELDV